MIVLSLNSATGQSNGQQKQFPSLPERPSISPTINQIQAWETFQSRHPGWKVRWNKKTGVPASLLGMPTKVSEGTSEVIARKFLSINRNILRMKTGLSDLMVNKIASMRRATHVVFTQNYRGIPVEGSVYAVHMTKDNKVYLASGDYFDNIEVTNTKPTINLDEAINTAKNDLGKSLVLRESASGNLVILPYGAIFLLTWKVTIPADDPMGEWVYFISATDGTILTGYDSADSEEAVGSVYDRHPDKGPVVDQVLTNLVSPVYYLDGDHIHVNNDDGGEAIYKLITMFKYSASNTHFDEVMTYYHADRFQSVYLDNIGYPYLNFPNLRVKVEATVHYGTNLNYAGAFSPNILRFGDGDGVSRNDYAKEDDVIYHEYMHLVTEYITDSGLDASWVYYNETDAMDEAFSDYFGASFAGSPLMGEYVKIGQGSLRNIYNSYTMSDWDGQSPDKWSYSDHHNGSQIFSGALWDLHQQLGQNIADIIAFEGLSNLDQATPTFLDGREAIIAADNASSSYNGVHVPTIMNVFAARGIGDPYNPPPAAPTNLIITNPTHYGNNPDLQWWASSGATSYNVYRNVDWDPDWVFIGSTTSTSYTDYDVFILNQYDWNSNLFSYHVTAINNVGESDPSNTKSVWGESYFKHRDELADRINPIPEDFALEPNHPNPFNPSTMIKYSLPQASSVSLVIYDLIGSEIFKWSNSKEDAGYKRITWNGKDQKGNSVPAGVYIYKLTAISHESDQVFTENRKMVLMK